MSAINILDYVHFVLLYRAADSYITEILKEQLHYKERVGAIRWIVMPIQFEEVLPINRMCTLTYMSMYLLMYAYPGP